MNADVTTTPVAASRIRTPATTSPITSGFLLRFGRSPVSSGAAALPWTPLWPAGADSGALHGAAAGAPNEFGVLSTGGPLVGGANAVWALGGTLPGGVAAGGVGQVGTPGCGMPLTGAPLTGDEPAGGALVGEAGAGVPAAAPYTPGPPAEPGPDAAVPGAAGALGGAALEAAAP
ncbi:hypothetical protein Val02_41440 [Virgisporangium aliadipatigenens]|uniref:Uncharacterized protein n=1 Tax=Virgisporangium aliadipatigenens TaxID=741659 RepID=A0A8J3YP69_9ACTN|nr:hypothetical protein Val02_41440 [Virgisporangium aliadipatigenens]